MGMQRWTRKSEQDKADGMKEEADMTDKVMHNEKNGWWLVKNADGRAKVTMNEERVLDVDWTEIKLCR